MRESLRRRLLVAALIGVTAALTLIGLLITHMFADYAESEFYEDLEGFEEEIAAALAQAPDHDATALTLLRPQFAKENSGYYWQIADGRGEIRRSPSLGGFVFTFPHDAVPPGTVHHHRLKGPGKTSVLAVEAMAAPSNAASSNAAPADAARPVRILVAVDARRVDSSTRAFRTLLIISFLALEGGLIFAAALQIWVGLQPLNRLRDRLTLVRDGLACRLDGTFPAEVAPLVDDLNTLLAHQKEVVERGRVLAGNLAHAFKTPLAVIANETAGLADGEAAARIEAQLGRMQRLVDYHTARARAAAARDVPGQRCALAPVVQSLCRVIERLYADRGLDLDIDLPPRLAFRGDRQDLEEMLGNLLDNAAKWARRRLRVEAAAAEDGWIGIAIDDDGPGLTEEQRNEAFGRGFRVDEEMPGSGLGLAIVRDLAEMYQGRVRLEASPLGGLRAVLHLPAAVVAEG